MRQSFLQESCQFLQNVHIRLHSNGYWLRQKCISQHTWPIISNVESLVYLIWRGNIVILYMQRVPVCFAKHI